MDILDKKFEQLKKDIILDIDNKVYSDKGIEPLFSAPRTAKILIIGQAPGLKAQESKIFFNDKSGVKLRGWMGIDNEIFYNSGLIGVVPMDFYYPGKGKEYAEKLRDYTITLYKKCAAYALEKGIIIADTKFEFGLDENGNITIGDEMLTPDSSRFWPAEGYEPGHGQPSFDKQFARDWLKENPDNDWTLPQEIVDKTIEKYLQGYEMLTGKKLD